MREHATQRRRDIAVTKSDGSRTKDGFLWRSVGVTKSGGYEEREGDGKLLSGVSEEERGEEKKKEETKTKPLAASQPVHKRIAAVQTSRPKVMVSSTTRKVGLGAKKTGGRGQRN